MPHSRAFIDMLKVNQERDPKCAVVLTSSDTTLALDQGCIIFSQYYDLIRWLATSTPAHDPLQRGHRHLRWGAALLGVMEDGGFRPIPREEAGADGAARRFAYSSGPMPRVRGSDLQRLWDVIDLNCPGNLTRLNSERPYSAYWAAAGRGVVRITCGIKNLSRTV